MKTLEIKGLKKSENAEESTYFFFELLGLIFMGTKKTDSSDLGHLDEGLQSVKY